MDAYVRIAKMETILNQYNDVLQQINPLVNQLEQLQKDYKSLMAYYRSPEYDADFVLPLKEDFPEDLTCHVLTEDAVYDLIRDNLDLAIQLLELGTTMVKSS
ncbi:MULTISPECIES: DUF4298 domain-containing protein [unclassified Granulicatella]|uniref:DUF4298 domain-containing protein n=1 Tax=unclassified Granulicatella TaxID=2630493 RepID=UPI001073F4DB|nr:MULTISPECIES: DUF4298 domain-containing protein [unclassified Granulicatella]MBF0780059.1 DUF4298 domain-containing protein [Granulicatella sp. 19428wC4_WM01]TFU95845.1 DUF4298 domain-containing protein [Granulicatella sp. WM01]